MQDCFSETAIFFLKPLYNISMTKKSRKHQPKQGERLAELRKAAGLSQHELARALGVRQSNIAFWEHSRKPPRSDILPGMAQALGVSVEQLLDSSAAPIKRRGGPIGKVRKFFELVSKLPRHQQDKIVEVVSVFVKHYQQEK